MSRVLFLDIETTGLDEHEDSVLEVYGRVFDLDTLEAGAEFYWLYSGTIYTEDVDPYVLEMHTKNGLWTAIEKNQKYTSLSEAFERFLHYTMGEEAAENKVVLAGRSVQFDRKFLARHTDHLHHRVYDIRSVIEFWTTNTPDKNLEERFMTSAELAEHRAKADVINDILLYQDIAHTMREQVFI